MHYIYTQIANHVITFDFQYTFKEKTKGVHRHRVSITRNVKRTRRRKKEEEEEIEEKRI